MPKESLNIYLTATDGISPVMTSIADKTKALDKESQQLEQTFEALQRANKGLIEQKTALQKQLQEVNVEVREAKKQFKELGDEASSDAYEKAQEKQQRIRDEITATTKAIQENQKAYKENIEIIRKGDLETKGLGLSDTAMSLIAGQAGQLFSSSLGGAFQAGLTSAVGVPMASLFSDTASSLISGAMAGVALGLPGILGGAALGTVSGLISGGTTINAAKDDAFKEYYNGLIDTYGGLSAGNAESGSGIASNWEDDLRTFSVLLNNNERLAKRFQASLIELGRTPPFSYDTVSALSKDMLGLGLSTKEALERINALAEAAAALDWSEGSVSTVISNLESAQLAGKLDSRVVKSLSKLGVNVYGALAEEFGISEDEVLDKLGKLDVDRAVDAIYSYLGEHFAGAAAGLENTYSGASGILASYQDDISAAAGEGYNTLRTEGLRAEINSLGGALGDAMKGINTIIGENQARSENLREEYMREAIAAVLLGEEGALFDEGQQAQLDEWAEKYAEAAERYERGEETAGLEMQALYENAQMMAQAWYDSSEWAQAEKDVQMEQIAAIRENTYGLAATTDALRESIEKSKGGAATTVEQEKLANTVDALTGTARDQMDPSMRGGYDLFGAFGEWTAEKLFGISDASSGISGGLGGASGLMAGSSHAYGLDRVPYDGYAALLHEGERVLTASEARGMDAGGRAPVIQVTVTGNNFVGAGEEMADQLAEILARKLEQEALIYQQ